MRVIMDLYGTIIARCKVVETIMVLHKYIIARYEPRSGQYL